MGFYCPILLLYVTLKIPFTIFITDGGLELSVVVTVVIDSSGKERLRKYLELQK